MEEAQKEVENLPIDDASWDKPLPVRDLPDYQRNNAVGHVHCEACE